MDKNECAPRRGLDSYTDFSGAEKPKYDKAGEPTPFVGSINHNIIPHPRVSKVKEVLSKKIIDINFEPAIDSIDVFVDVTYVNDLGVIKTTKPSIHLGELSDEEVESIISNFKAQFIKKIEKSRAEVTSLKIEEELIRQGKQYKNMNW